MYNILTEIPPCSVTVDGMEYAIYTDWKDWVRYLCMMEDSTVKQTEKVYIAMEFFKGEKPVNTISALEALKDFSACCDIPQTGTPKKQESSTGSKPLLLSFLYDAPFIYAAFMQVYGIDLACTKMHWYRFFSLFQGLPEETPIKRRMEIRSMKLSDADSREHKNKIIKAQNAVRIPRKEVSDTDVSAAFMADWGWT